MHNSLRLPLLVAAVLVLLSTTGGLWAQESGNRHGLAVFLGDTYDDGSHGFTLGLDYEYRLSKWVGLGAMVDFVGSGDREYVVGVPVFLHATRRLTFELAAGMERADSGSNALVRLGAMYGIPLGPVDLVPAFMLDFVDSDTVYVFGVAFSWQF
ncbi:MAG: hypothetical protein WBG00_14370 [Thermoanaerobaculia bacterium]